MGDNFGGMGDKDEYFLKKLNEKIENEKGNQNPKFYLLRALKYKEMKRYGELLVDTEHGISCCRPSDLGTFTKLSNLQAEVYLDQNNPKKAQDTLVKLFDLHVLMAGHIGNVICDSESHMLAVRLYMIKGKFNEAQYLFKYAIEIAESNCLRDVLSTARPLMQYFLDCHKEENDKIISQIEEQKPRRSQLEKDKSSKKATGNKGKRKGKKGKRTTNNFEHVAAMNSCGVGNEEDASRDAKQSITKDLPSGPHKMKDVDETSYKFEDVSRKLIYVHVFTLGESLLKEPHDIFSGYKDATNDWYVIKQGSEGGVQILRVFEDIETFNSPNHALESSSCEVIGSCIYLIGGRSVYWQIYGSHVKDPGSSMIRCLDTHNTKDGWRTVSTLPFMVTVSKSAVVDDKWLYFFGAHRSDIGEQPEPYCYALNVYGNSKKQVKIATIPRPTYFPIFGNLSRNALVVYMEMEGAFYQLDCTNSNWTLYQKGLPYRPSDIIGCTIVSDGIFYMYDTEKMRLISYDIRNKKELPQVEFPPSFWFGHNREVNLIVLGKNKFCLVWYGGGKSANYISIVYTRFSVSYDLPKPAVSIEEKQYFHNIPGCLLVNVVAV